MSIQYGMCNNSKQCASLFPRHKGKHHFGPQCMQKIIHNCGTLKNQKQGLIRVSIFGNFCFRANCAVCGAKFFLRAIPHFLRRDTQTRLRGFARFCAQILRRKTKFCVPPQILRVFARKFCGGTQKFLWRGGKFFLRGAKT